MTEEWNAEKEELILYADNESELYPQKKSIIANLKKKIEAGKYDKALAPKLWLYWLDKAATKYCKEFKCEVIRTFPMQVRKAAAEEVAKREHQAILNGEYGEVSVKTSSKASSKRKLPKLELVRLKLDRQGYVNGRYYGTGAPLFEATNPDTNITVTLRAPDRPTALQVVKRMFTDPKDKSVTDRFVHSEIRAFVGDD